MSAHMAISGQTTKAEKDILHLSVVKLRIMAKKKYYAVKKGVKPGIYGTWPEAELQVKGYPGAKFKGFVNRQEAAAWMEDGQAASDNSGQRKADSTVSLGVEKGQLLIYTDGGAINNPGPGGYGVVIVDQDGQRELSGGFRHTTNNRMELTACIAALREVEGSGCRITLFSDSSYVVNGISKGWVYNWRRNGWLKADKKPVLNKDLWQDLLELEEKLDIEFKWVRGHAGNPLNERCDRLAVGAARGIDLQVDDGYEKEM